jgi:hypothetical protein
MTSLRSMIGPPRGLDDGGCATMAQPCGLAIAITPAGHGS